MSSTPIIIFETMIFIDDDREHELADYQERYSTEEEARAGHIKACEMANIAADKDLKNKIGFMMSQGDKEKKNV
jgi:hypothetical protein